MKRTKKHTMWQVRSNSNLSESKENFRSTFQGNKNPNNERFFKYIKRTDSFSKHLSSAYFMSIKRTRGAIIDLKGTQGGKMD